ncbi:glycoside hydrolase family 18 protein [Sphaerisporangium corydalis]|uniref:Glycosyl hydrolase family 18 protein n=1 Tax=Sphaerisporangium corydalis TaxID=1441875 RepID=A0ABV9E5P4_9ACTN|nr:glycosyl hydrolase family 18 protein [Sphaerisporangium corydalis]
MTVLFLVSGVLAVASGAALYALSLGTPAPGSFTRGQDAMWLGHAWVDGRNGDRELATLAARLRDGGVRDVYLHTGPLSYDGTLPTSLYPRAAWAITSLRRAVPGLKVHAWLGQRVDPGKLDLSSPAVRAAVARAAVQVIAAGFDGVHYNFEPVPDGDPGLLDLLDRTRAAVPPGRGVLSMSVHHIEPLPGMSRVGGLVLGHAKWWTPGYLTEVARRLDQVAVMSYDTAQPTEALYTGYVRRQTELALAAVPPGTRLVMGLPAYHDDNLTHHASAETVRAALLGVRLGLGRSGRANFGVALYVDFAATEADWDDYRQDWTAPSGARRVETR